MLTKEDFEFKPGSKLILDSNGWPVFPGTTADLRYVDKAIKREEADITSSSCFLELIRKNKDMALKILMNYIDPMTNKFTGIRRASKK